MSRKILSAIWSGWKKFAHSIGRVNTFILLSVFYFVIFGFIAIIKKTIDLFGRKETADSYWRDPAEEDSDFEKQF